jgi:hypothetical protein
MLHCHHASRNRPINMSSPLPVLPHPQRPRQAHNSRDDAARLRLHPSGSSRVAEMLKHCAVSLHANVHLCTVPRHPSPTANIPPHHPVLYVQQPHDACTRCGAPWYCNAQAPTTLLCVLLVCACCGRCPFNPSCQRPRSHCCCSSPTCRRRATPPPNVLQLSPYLALLERAVKKQQVIAELETWARHAAQHDATPTARSSLCKPPLGKTCLACC